MINSSINFRYIKFIVICNVKSILLEYVKYITIYVNIYVFNFILLMILFACIIKLLIFTVFITLSDK
jgi:hypothetical protein